MHMFYEYVLKRLQAFQYCVDLEFGGHECVEGVRPVPRTGGETGLTIVGRAADGHGVVVLA